MSKTENEPISHESPEMLKRRAQQLEINQNWLMAKIDQIHALICPDHIGTWQQRAEHAVRAAQKLARPAPTEGSRHMDALQILEYLNRKCSKNFRPVPSTLTPIKARLKEKDVTVEGVKQMIDRQYLKWSGTDMEEYLRPSTLFRPSKFENYYTAKDLPVEGAKRKFGDLCYDDTE